METEECNVMDLKRQCFPCKNNITKGKISSHHNSMSYVYGFDVKKETWINWKTGSSITQYVCNTKDMDLITALDTKLIKTMEKVWLHIHHFIAGICIKRILLNWKLVIERYCIGDFIMISISKGNRVYLTFL